jgi:hypothetical protein
MSHTQRIHSLGMMVLGPHPIAVKNPSRVEMSIDSSIPSASSRNSSSSLISSSVNGLGLSIFTAAGNSRRPSRSGFRSADPPYTHRVELAIVPARAFPKTRGADLEETGAKSRITRPSVHSGDAGRRVPETRPSYPALADALSAGSVRPSRGRGAFASRGSSRDIWQRRA